MRNFRILFLSLATAGSITQAKVDFSAPRTPWQINQSALTHEHVRIVSKVESLVRQGVPVIPLRRVLEVYLSNLGQTLAVKTGENETRTATLSNDRYVAIADYTRPSTEKRFYLIDLKLGKVEKHYVSHGSKSGSLYAQFFSNKPNTRQTSLGLFLTGDTYESKNFKGTAMKLYGLEMTNNNAYERYIVAHPASYASEKFIEERRAEYEQTKDRKNRPRLGRSWGCFAFDPAVSDQIINKLKDGALIYSYIEGAEKKILESAEYQDFQRVPPEEDETNESLEELLQKELTPEEAAKLKKNSSPSSNNKNRTVKS